MMIPGPATSTKPTLTQQSSAQWMLVTGGRGFIGSHLVEHLLGSGRRVIAVDIVPVAGQAREGLRELQCDIRDAAAMADLFRQYDVDTVIDLASFTEVDLDAAAYRRNVEATDAMTGCLAGQPHCKYLFYSTQFVHRIAGRGPVDEHDYHPVEAYGESKVLSERLIHERLPRDRFLILRPSYIWGPGLARFRDGLLKNLRKGRMLVPNDPSLRRSYGYVKTIAAQTAEFARRDFNSLTHKVYYLTDEPIALSTFCDHLLEAMGTGGYHKVPGWLIRFLGAAGDFGRRLGMPAPINSTQARELVTDFPVPWRRSLELATVRTDYTIAARETVVWAEMKR
jgi:nucleoside-diphosphate-sugar epimerase